MSKYARSSTEFTDADLLVESLLDLGYLVEHHMKAEKLNGWLNNSRAEIIIRKNELDGAHADIGFRLDNKSGTYTMLADEDDMRNYGYGRVWVNKVKATYREKATIQTATQRLGLRFVSSTIDDNGKTRLEFLKI